jgi:hypothetical protein
LIERDGDNRSGRSYLVDRRLIERESAFSALLDDLAQRGLLEESLVVWTGKFGQFETQRPCCPLTEKQTCT